MSQYVVTIIPVGGDDEFAGPVSQTIVRIDADSGHTWVRELTIRAADGGGLSEDEIPQVDFAMLVRAFNRPGASPATNPMPPAPAVAKPAPPPRATASGPAGRRGAQRSASRERGTAGRLRTGRAYRRAPGAEELEAAYEQTGTVAGVAAHFGVPVHTAQGWISRLRRNYTELAGS